MLVPTRPAPRRRSLASISRRGTLALALAVTGASGVACGGAPPPAAPVGPAKPTATVKATPPPDMSPVPAPEGLLAIGRVSKPDELLRTAAGWVNLPLPGASDLLRSITDDTVGDAVDLTQPIDAAVALEGTRSPEPIVAISFAVRSFEDARAKLAAAHPVAEAENGSLIVSGVADPPPEPGRELDPEAEDDRRICMLAHAVRGARFVCGDSRHSVDVLVPYLTRTMPNKSWSSDVHVELRLESLREPLQQVRASLPILARSMLDAKGGGALAALIESSVGEVVDFVGDTGRIAMDFDAKDTGLNGTVRVDYTSKKSLIARIGTAHPERAAAPPASFFHLPAETDVAGFGRGVDAKLLDHPRELLANVIREAAEDASMPKEDATALRALFVDRLMPLFEGPLVYGKGYDAAALDKAVDARKNAKRGDTVARDQAETAVAFQVIGWHLLRVEQPITSVGPIFKDAAKFWKRPGFAKWLKKESDGKPVSLRTAAAPKGVKLPKGSVHLEVVIPQSDLRVGIATHGKASKKPPQKPKRVKRKPVVFHAIAVPDQGATWLAMGFDAKLAAQKALASLSSAPDEETLGKARAAAGWRNLKVSGLGVFTIRGLTVVTALDEYRSPFEKIRMLPNRGNTPIVFTGTPMPPSAAAPAGSSVSTFEIPRAVIEDVVRLATLVH